MAGLEALVECRRKPLTNRMGAVELMELTILRLKGLHSSDLHWSLELLYPIFNDWEATTG